MNWTAIVCLWRLRNLEWRRFIIGPLCVLFFGFSTPILPAATLTTLYSFTNGIDGGYPEASLVQGSDGNFYGTTYEGGTNGLGTIFKVTSSGVFKPLYSFTGGTDGALQYASLVQGTDGSFYGTTFDGGTNGFGSVFKVTSSGVFTPLYSFTGGVDGAYPEASLIQGSDGNFYGAAGFGIFKMTSGGALTTLCSGTNGMEGPYEPVSLVQGSDGNFYGTTFGPAYSHGTIFKITSGGALTTLYWFPYPPLSDYANGGLVQGSDGDFYGTAVGAGTKCEGMIFKITSNGALTMLYSFTNGVDGAEPVAGLVLGSDGNFYGTGYGGGTNGYGSIFRITPNGVFTSLYSFANGVDGAYPRAGLVQGTDGNFYGTAEMGGSRGYGTVFRLCLSDAPFIVTQPGGQSVPAGASPAFNVVADGQQPLSYQWQFNGQNIPHATGAGLTINNVQLTDAGNYSVVVANAYGSVRSAVVQLTVSAPVVLTQANRTPKSAEIGSATIPADNNLKVFANGTFQGGIALDPTKTTVVLTHGWNSSPSDWPEYMAQIIQKRIGANVVNIVAWDWSVAAQTTFDPTGLGLAVGRTPGVGNAVGRSLVAALGANYSQHIHFIGHSLGTLVNGVAADYVHAHGFSWMNTQMTLCDEAEIATVFTSTGWQTATTLPLQIRQAGSTILTLWGNSSSPQRYWDHPLPKDFAWADNYITLCGLLHLNAANAILSYEYPIVLYDSTFHDQLQEFTVFHEYYHFFYADTIEPSLYNTGGRTDATYLGFICSFEGGGTAKRSAANTYFYQDSDGLELNLVQKDFAFATDNLNARFSEFLDIWKSWAEDQAINWAASEVGVGNGQASGQVTFREDC